MRDAVLTVRVTLETRRRLEELARREGRSLSRQVERLLTQGLGEVRVSSAHRTPEPLSGRLAGGRVPDLADFREVRRELSAALARANRERVRR